MGCVDDAFERRSQGIINGEPALGPSYAATAAMVVDLGGRRTSYCSAVLISPTLLLSAAHCLTDAQAFPFAKLWEEGVIKIVFGESVDAAKADEIFEIRDFVLHPQFDSDKGKRDLALVYLDRPVAPSLAEPVVFASNSKAIAAAALEHLPATLVGYGRDAQDVSDLRMKFDSFIYKYCGSGTQAAGTNCIESTPDGMRLVMPLGSLAFDISKGGACDGDSGGAVLADINGVTTVIGIITSGDSDCRIYALAMSIADVQAWIAAHLYAKQDGCTTVLTVHRRTNSNLWPWLILLLSLAFFGWRRRVKRDVWERL